jgi:hypothetical protein
MPARVDGSSWGGFGSLCFAFRVGGWSWGGFGSLCFAFSCGRMVMGRLRQHTFMSPCARIVVAPPAGSTEAVKVCANRRIHDGRSSRWRAVGSGSRYGDGWSTRTPSVCFCSPPRGEGLLMVACSKDLRSQGGRSQGAAVGGPQSGGPHSGRQHSNVCSWNGRTRMSALRTSDRGAVLRRRVAGRPAIRQPIDHRRREVGVCTSDYWPTYL